MTASPPVLLHGVEVHPRVVDLTARLAIQLDAVSDAVLDPEATWPGRDGTSTVHLRGGVAAIVADSTGEVVAITNRETALRGRAQPRYGAVRRSHGGVGSRMPRDTGELLRRLRAAGFKVERDGNHLVVTHLSRPGQVTIAKSPSDYRSLPNSVMQIRTTFGVDLRTA